MQAIHDNPYRIVGVLANASAREKQKQITKGLRYAGIGKSIDSEFDFNFLEEVERDTENLNQSSSSIQQGQDCVSHALFWFINHNSFDDIAIQHLIQGNRENALEIWGKVTAGKEVSSRNFSSFNNIGTLKLLEQYTSDLQGGVEAKMSLVESDSFSEFAHLVAGQTFVLDKKIQTEKLIDKLLAELDNLWDLSIDDTLELFENCSSSSRQYLSQKFTQTPIYNIERRIEKAKTGRKSNKSNAYSLGFELYKESKAELSTLASLLGKRDLQYKMIADNLAKEVLQCGVDYFQYHKEDKDPSQEGLRLLKFAKSIAVGAQTKERVADNINGMEEWAKMAPIQSDVKVITDKFQKLEYLPSSVDTAKSLVKETQSNLSNLKNILGSDDAFYLQISSAVVNHALGIIVAVVNEAQENVQNNHARLLKLAVATNEAESAVDSFRHVDMDDQTRQRYNENRSTITVLNFQMKDIERKIIGQSSRSNTSSSDTDDINWVKIIGWGIFIIVMLRACAE